MVVEKTKQVTVATLLEALKNRPTGGGMDCVEFSIAINKFLEDFEGLLLQFQKQLQNFKVLNRGTNETNASCCCHFEKVSDFECPLRKRILGDVTK